jgi:hypothetical protein
LHGCKPNSIAFAVEISSETFFTILQFDKWYFKPEGVLKTVWAFRERGRSKRKRNLWLRYYL